MTSRMRAGFGKITVQVQSNISKIIKDKAWHGMKFKHTQKNLLCNVQFLVLKFFMLVFTV